MSQWASSLRKIKNFLSFYMLELPIDPLRLKRKMYSPLSESISVKKADDFRASILKSQRLRMQNLRIKESIIVELESVLPKE